MSCLRKEFFSLLEQIMEKEKKVLFMTCDLGYGFYENIKNRFPNQFLNAGCIEQATTGIATGLAMSGFKVYLYSTIPFILFRNYEQLRNDICYQNNNVKLIGVSHSGFLGWSHNLEGAENEEDLLKNLPNIKTYYPATAIELENIMKLENKRSGPAYIRL